MNYVFANDTDRDIHTVVAFPMPEVTGGPEQNIAVYDPNSDEPVEGPQFVATPVFDGATEEEISDAIEAATR